jgi:hypothetical protein
MSTFVRHAAALVGAIALVSACGPDGPTGTSTGSPPTAPSTTAPVPPSRAAQITLTGRVTDSDSSDPIADAVVSINGRYSARSDASGRYSVAGPLDLSFDYTYVSAPGYESDYRFISGMLDGRQDFRLHPIDRIQAGESKAVTVAPDDSLCVNNVQDMPGVGPSFLCRSLRVLAPSSGVLTIESFHRKARASAGGSRDRQFPSAATSALKTRRRFGSRPASRCASA